MQSWKKVVSTNREVKVGMSNMENEVVITLNKVWVSSRCVMARVYKTLCKDDKISEDKTVLKQMEVGYVVWKTILQAC